MQTRTHRQLSPVLLVATVGLLTCGCRPHNTPRSYALAESTTTELADRPEVQAKISGALEMLYGTPQTPRYMLVDEWVDEGFDPNWPTYEVGDMGSGEFDDEDFERMFEGKAGEKDRFGNTDRFKDELARIDAGDYDQLGPFRGSPGLQASIDYVLEHPDEFEDVGAELRRTLVEYYPSLTDSAELYRLECLHCHGNSGGGDGPTANFLNPLPRDYRHGVFKFTAVKDKAQPRREDLYKILHDGVTGTAMPSFARFSEAQLEGLVDYVRLLSMRGMTERLLLANYQSEEVLTPQTVIETYTDVFGRWQEADEKYIAFDGEIPEPTAEMLARGEEIFNDAKTGNCASCHGVEGLGNGAAVWKAAEDGSGERVPAYFDDWGQPSFPRNLTLGIFRGGKRPIDIYRRVYAGINGTPMPAIGESKDADGNPLLDDEDMWSLVHYVRSLSERPDGLGIEPHPLVGDQAVAADTTHAGGSEPSAH